MQLSQLEFGSLLSYSPRGNSIKILHARDFMIALKTEKFVEGPRTLKAVLMSKWVAETIQHDRGTLPFSSYFHPNAMLVPIPKSSLMKPDTLWVPERIASALAEIGFGKVLPCIRRVKSVPKSASSLPTERPTPIDHYNSFRINGSLSEPDEIVLVDDVVTRGATLLGAANRVVEAFPKTRIRAFAVMRTISNPSDFIQLYDPCEGTIKLRESGDTLRRP